MARTVHAAGARSEGLGHQTHHADRTGAPDGARDRGGIALGVGGALIQGYTRNPIADTGLLGVNTGASFAVVSAISLFGFTDPFQYVWFAFLGAAIAGVVVFGLSSIGRGPAIR